MNYNLSKFEKKCLALNIGYDNIVCDGKYCAYRMTCIRYMLHKKATIERYEGELYYVRKFFNKECYLKYESEN